MYGILTKRQAEVLRYYMLGYKQEEIARILNISQPRVSRILKTALKKVELAMETVKYYKELKKLKNARKMGYKEVIID